MTAERPAPSAGLSARLLSLGRVWLDVTAQTASLEAARELSRMTGGVLLYAAGMVLLSIAMLFAQVGAVVLLQEAFGWRWSICMLLVAVPDAVLAAVVLRVAITRLQAPVMPQTRALVGKSARALAG